GEDGWAFAATAEVTGAGLVVFFASGFGGVTFLATLPFRVASTLATFGATLAAGLAATPFALAGLADGRTVALRSGALVFFATAFAAVFLRVIVLVPLATSDCILCFPQLLCFPQHFPQRA